MSVEESTGGPGMFDRERLFAMEDLFQQALPASLARFLDNAALYTGEIVQAVARQDWQIARDNAHKLKSSAAMFGLPAMSALCVEIEAKAMSTDRGGIDRLSQDLQARVDEAKALFAPFLDQPGQSLREWVATLDKTE